MLAWTIVGAVAGALVAAGMFFAWYVRYARSEEHRLTQLEANYEKLSDAVDGLVEESGKDAEYTREFTSFVKGELSSSKYRIEALEDRLKNRR